MTAEPLDAAMHLRELTETRRLRRLSVAAELWLRYRNVAKATMHGFRSSLASSSLGHPAPASSPRASSRPPGDREGWL